MAAEQITQALRQFTLGLSVDDNSQGLREPEPASGHAAPCWIDYPAYPFISRIYP
jgi:hypothetical protein